jgi:cell division protein FtsQ
LKQSIKNKIYFSLWLLVGVGILVLFVAAFQQRKNETCQNFIIKINNHQQSNFVTQSEISELLNANGELKKKPIKKINLALLERVIEKNPWVKNTELYFENNNVLHIDIEQNQAIARLITVNSNSYYLDESGKRLPIKPNASTRVMVITNFPSDHEKLSTPDSLLLTQIISLAKMIRVDSFLNAQIAQVNVDFSGKFELIPALGNQTILFGDISNAKEKFEKLLAFYQSVWIKNGINTYEIIDVRFNNQIVAKRKESHQFIKDSLSINNNFKDSIR